MAKALSEAQAAEACGEVPIGAVITGPEGAILAAAGNRTRMTGDPTAHAEMLAIREACAKLGSERLIVSEPDTSVQSRPMCAAAISFARIRRLYYGAADAKGGGVEHGSRVFNQPTCNHAPEIYAGIDEERAGALLKAFFEAKR